MLTGVSVPGRILEAGKSRNGTPRSRPGEIIWSPGCQNDQCRPDCRGGRTRCGRVFSARERKWNVLLMRTMILEACVRSWSTWRGWGGLCDLDLILGEKSVSKKKQILSWIFPLSMKRPRWQMSRNEVFGELGRSRGMSRPPSSPPHWGAGASRWVDGLIDEKREKRNWSLIGWSA